MNKQELVSKISEVTGGTKKDADMYVKAFLDVVVNELSVGGEVNLLGFGKFSTKEVSKKTGIIHLGEKKGQTYTTPKHNKPVFKFGKSVKDILYN